MYFMIKQIYFVFLEVINNKMLQVKREMFPQADA